MIGSNACQIAPAREPLVTQEFNRIGNNICNLESAIEQVRQRITAILTDSVSLPTCDRSKQEVLPPLADGLRSMNDRLVELDRQIHDLLSRIEL